MKNRNYKTKKTLTAALLVGVLVAFPILTGCRKQETQATDVSVATESQAIDNSITWKGKKYVYNDNLTNILFLGIDKSDAFEEKYQFGDAGQSDCIMLLSLDTQTKQGRILQINRNTMTNLDIYDSSGNYMYSEDGQLALQYAYDIGGESSCWAVRKTVEELLFGLPIEGCFAMDMAGIAEINDALGGVDVTIQEDYTQIDASFIQGSTVHLEGDLAQKFLRYRNLEEFNSVEDRMHRQVVYITAMIESMKTSGSRQLYDILSPYLDTYIITDLDAEHLNALTSYDYLTEEVQYLPGEMVQGDIYEEYYVDDEALQDLLIQSFYREVE
jgi:LCP family protein required for cell wall assembly